jgi:hypothetical protein
MFGNQTLKETPVLISNLYKADPNAIDNILGISNVGLRPYHLATDFHGFAIWRFNRHSNNFVKAQQLLAVNE